MASTVNEKPRRSLDLETGSNLSGALDKKDPHGPDHPEDNKTTSSLAREDGEEINYNTLTWW